MKIFVYICKLLACFPIYSVLMVYCILLIKHGLPLCEKFMQGMIGEGLITAGCMLIAYILMDLLYKTK